MNTTTKKDNSAAIAEFLAKGGKITVCPPSDKPKPRNTNAVSTVEIEIEALPLELQRFLNVG